LDSLTILQITPEDQAQIDREISATEVVQAIKSMQSNKAPGPDGFSIDYYKEFAANWHQFLNYYIMTFINKRDYLRQ